ncbi:dnaJ homolog subfamily C member 16 isoform X1 [Syngnathus scovelli]|uniref:dnaJ homolog subfamily C member 16 isoform X1 n=2 Tax=Syngnathus scovelli TaxID=161590 RepID=UPI00210FA410|nr:dnaJ homolog subfamily C member 16 isoform X1 [Syngnathus scovelli]XP_049610863.1 dnaJ homolog subfamily C member 16 isoform X1 [Syngnathus scovelli]XP_049610864.1 dnaJ homolog subfamily C member 16 isoform X1 [Syngnathus scovelli]XP_049610865.1 dnaJ homolog subfamily C member 16 isoform X1 [Syngnathus scovelli]
MADFKMSLPLAVIVVISVLELGVAKAGPELDPYKTLGVTRGASQIEIKKVYKRLAREWHPDKNKNPGAEDMFIRITKSYEILSSEDKRANYDHYGQTDDTQPYGSSRYGGHRHDNFNFEESFFNFPFNSKNHRDFSDSKYSLHFNQYVNDVVPDSFRRPYLIKITSDWCFNCIHIEPVWKEVVQEMETLGVGIGVVDVGYERRLANHLGAHRTPSILGVINGKVTFFHYAVAKEHLRQFVEDLLPQRLVEWVSDKNEKRFLNSWHELNKPHVLLFDQVPAVPLLYKLTAFAYKDYMQFGYVDQGLSETVELQRQFNINTYAPTMLVFKENTDNPADIIQTKGMKKQIIDEFMSNNKFLLAPRLVNQKLFDELCPVKQFHRRRKYCVLLITGNDESFSPGNQAFLAFASSNTKEVVRFTYVYQQLQQPLCNILMTSKDSTKIPLPPQVVILERRNAAGKALFKPVTPWNGTEEDKQRLVAELQRLQKDPSILIHDAMLPELNNEFASIFVIQWIYAFYDYLTEVIDDILHNNWREMMPLLSLIFSALFILFGTVVVQAFSDSSDENTPKPKAKDTTKTENGSPGSPGPSSRPPKKNFVEVTELTDITYISNLVRLRPGHMNIVLVITDASKNILLSKFAKEVYSFTGSPALHFSFLNTDKHREWMCTLMESAQDAAQIFACEDDEANANLDYTGSVLALNGHKKYFCLFKPVYTGEDPDSKMPEDESAPSVRRSRAASRDEHPPRKSARSRSTSTLQIHHKLDRLGLWMERLMEGTLARYYVLAWPGLHKITPSK